MALVPCPTSPTVRIGWPGEFSLHRDRPLVGLELFNIPPPAPVAALISHIFLNRETYHQVSRKVAIKYGPIYWLYIVNTVKLLYKCIVIFLCCPALPVML